MKLSYDFVSRLCERHNWEWCGSYGEPGYQDDTTTVVILGDYWDRKHQRATGELRGIWHRHPRIEQQLADQGVQMEWYDEWTIDWEADKAYRTEGDSYSWTPSYAYDESCEIITPDSDAETWLDYAANRTDVAVTDSQKPGFESWLIDNGWTRRPGDRDYANGWYPGQNDNPTDIASELRADHDDIDVVFVITGVGQFDCHFAAYYRPAHVTADDLVSV